MVEAIWGEHKTGDQIIAILKRFEDAGELGLVTAGAAANDEWPAIAPRIQAMTVSDGRVVAIYDIANPDKFTGSPLGDARARGTRYVKPTAPGRRPRS
jgi:RNA polymerase sigma-70 factor (ECF subfamily)